MILQEEGENMDYRIKAINCVKDTVLLEQMRQFKECNCNLDEFYKQDDTESLFTQIIEPGHIYEVGFPKCVCAEVLSGNVKDSAHCECSRQSVLYVLENLLPDNKITVEKIETILSGAEKCRFRVSVDK